MTRGQKKVSKVVLIDERDEESMSDTITPDPEQPGELVFTEAELKAAEQYMEDGEVSTDLLSLFAKRGDVDHMALTADYNKRFVLAFQYQGFDPNYMYGYLSSKAGNPRQLSMDMVKIAILFMWRGSNVDKMGSSMTPEGLKMLQVLVLRYNIKPRVKGQSRRTCVTLPRICATLPKYSMEAMIQTKPPPIRSCIGNLHCLLRVTPAQGFYKVSYAEHVYYLALANNVILGSIIGGKDDTVGTVNGFFSAAQSSPKVDEDSTYQLMNDSNLRIPPLNWSDIGPKIKMLLMQSTMSLPSAAQYLEPYLLDIIVPPEWYPYTRPTAGFPVGTVVPEP